MLCKIEAIDHTKVIPDFAFFPERDNPPAFCALSILKCITAMTKLSTVKTEQVSTQVVIASIEKKAGKHLNQLTGLPIKSKEDYELKAIALKELKSYRKEAEVQEATIAAPLKKAWDATKQLFKPFYTKVDNAELLTKKSMLTFIAEQDVKIKKLEAKFEKGEIKKVNTLLDKKSSLTIISNASSVRVTKELVIVDEKVIPREYLIPDLAKIKAALKNGVAVSGCKLDYKKGLAI